MAGSIELKVPDGSQKSDQKFIQLQKQGDSPMSSSQFKFMNTNNIDFGSAKRSRDPFDEIDEFLDINE